MDVYSITFSDLYSKTKFNGKYSILYKNTIIFWVYENNIFLNDDINIDLIKDLNFLDFYTDFDKIVEKYDKIKMKLDVCYDNKSLYELIKRYEKYIDQVIVYFNKSFQNLATSGLKLNNLFLKPAENESELMNVNMSVNKMTLKLNHKNEIEEKTLFSLLLIQYVHIFEIECDLGEIELKFIFECLKTWDLTTFYLKSNFYNLNKKDGKKYLELIGSYLRHVNTVIIINSDIENVDIFQYLNFKEIFNDYNNPNNLKNLSLIGFDPDNINFEIFSNLNNLEYFRIDTYEDFDYDLNHVILLNKIIIKNNKNLKKLDIYAPGNSKDLSELLDLIIHSKIEDLRINRNFREDDFEIIKNNLQKSIRPIVINTNDEDLIKELEIFNKLNLKTKQKKFEDKKEENYDLFIKYSPSNEMEDENIYSLKRKKKYYFIDDDNFKKKKKTNFKLKIKKDLNEFDKINGIGSIIMFQKEDGRWIKGKVIIEKNIEYESILKKLYIIETEKSEIFSLMKISYDKILYLKDGKLNIEQENEINNN